MFDSDLTMARDALRLALTPYGLWVPGPGLPADATELADLAAELDTTPFGGLWLGGSPAADLPRVRELMAGSRRLVVGTSVLNVWLNDAPAVAAAAREVRAEHGRRFVLGVGAGHRAIVERVSDQRYEKPYSKVVSFLDELDAASPAAPAAWRAVAALGPRTLQLAGERSLGAVPLLTTPDHTRQARELFGAGPLLVPEQGVLLESHPSRAREQAREALAYYFSLPNYTNAWRRLGFGEDDVAAPGSDRMIDALVAWGSPEAVAARLREHLDAGADQVAVQPLAPRGAPVPHDTWRRLAQVLPVTA
jgi:probable F420-dependent oxidoreductase